MSPLAIRFAGLTNGATFVEFIVSNSNDRTILFWPAKPQIKSKGEWSQELNVLPVRDTTLRAREMARFTVTAPTNAHAEAWRAPVLWVLKPSKKEWVDEVVRQNMAALESGGALPGIRIGWGFSEAWTNYSPEVNP
jgi:hypothetical protein